MRVRKRKLPKKFWAFKSKNLILTFGKLLILPVVVFVIFSLNGNALALSKDGKIRTVVIDAGHGGKDPGAMGKTIAEKRITLAVALKVGEYITKNHPDTKVIYTRKDDHFVELYRRADIANKNKADLFISIHCNASKSRLHYGAETFVMGLHRSQANLEVAKLENAAVLYEDNYQSQYDGFDPNAPETEILFSMYQNLYRRQSLLLASNIQNQLNAVASRFDRGVKEAGFLVLYRTTMPSVLVELGFISNENEEKFLKSKAGQEKLALSIANAFTAYKMEIESLPFTPNAALAETEPIKDSEATSMEKSPQGETLDIAAKAQPINETQTAASAKSLTLGAESSAIVYRVQIAASAQPLGKDHPSFKGLKDIWEYKHKGMYKYTSGYFTNEKEALHYRDQLRKQDFKDAFVVPFKGDQRLNP